MSLNKLISKYLDGELTSTEDDALRSLLSEKKSARDKFDAAVHLHIAFREDAESIKAPEELVRETEDIVLMEILSQPPVTMTRKRFGSRYFYSPFVLGMLVIFFMSSIFKIHDLNSNLNNNLNNNFGSDTYGTLADNIIIPDVPAGQSGEMLNVENNSDEKNNSVQSQSLQNETYLLSEAALKQASDKLKNYRLKKSSDKSFSEKSLSDNNSANENISAVLNYEANSGSAAGSSDISDAGQSGDLLAANPIMPEADILDGSSAFALNTIESNTIESNTIESNTIDNEGAPNLNPTQTSDNPGFESSRLISANITDSPVNTANKPTGKMSLGLANIKNTTISNNPAISNNIAMMNLNPFGNLYEINDVQITTFAGSDYYRNGVDAKGSSAISHVSQSIGYGVGNSSRIGVEFGYTQYSFDERMTISVPPGKAASHSSIEVVNPSDQEDGFIAIPIVFNRRQKLFWGAAFYERTIVDDYGGLSLITRGGIGGSSDGLLGYARIFGKFEIISGVFINIGTEYRMFMSGAPQFSRQSDWKETGSLIYGLQFKL